MMTRLSDFFVMIGPEWYRRVDEDDESIVYTDKTVMAFTGWFPPRWVSVRSLTFVGKQENKDTFFMEPEVSIKPVEKLRLELGMSRMDREGERLMLNRRLEFSYQFSHQMFFRTALEVTRNDERNLFILYGWEFRPESHFFLVYTDDKNGNEEAERIVFAKLSYLLKWKIF